MCIKIKQSKFLFIFFCLGSNGQGFLEPLHTVDISMRLKCGFADDLEMFLSKSFDILNLIGITSNYEFRMIIEMKGKGTVTLVL